MTQKRTTWQKTAVNERLAASEGFVSAQQLHQQLVADGTKLGLTTVYRALTELVEQDQADTLVLGDGEMRYRICTPEHHHHLICGQCGKTVEFDLPGFETQAQQIARDNGFTVESHELELIGTCADCAN